MKFTGTSLLDFRFPLSINQAAGLGSCELHFPPGAKREDRSADLRFKVRGLGGLAQRETLRFGILGMTNGKGSEAGITGP